MKNKKNKQKRGIALIISVGVLALIAMVATSFAINMQIEYKAASNFYHSSVATQIAKGAADIAIADIRNWVKTVNYQTVLDNIANNYSTTTSPEVVIPGTTNTYKVTVEREEVTVDSTPLQKININTLDETDYPWIDRLKAAGLSYDEIAKIIDYRGDSPTSTSFLLTNSARGYHDPWVQACNSEGVAVKYAPYASLEEVKLVLNLNDARYNAIKDMITIASPVIRGGLIAKYYSNRISWDSSTILNVANFRGKIIELGRRCQSWEPGKTFAGVDGDNGGWSEAHDGEWAGGYIGIDWSVGAGLDQYGAVFTGYIYIPSSRLNQNIQFWVTSRDGGKLYIDGNQVTSYWSTSGGNREESGNVTFTYAGWHPIRMEYFNYTHENVLYLEWNALPYTWDPYGGNQRFLVLSDYLGYCPTSFYGKIYDYGNIGAPVQKFIMEESLQPTTTGIQYDQAGVFRITSTGKVKDASGSTLATKQITATVRAFGTWTQTTRSEFSGAWFSDYYAQGNSYGGAGFSDGELRNVNWMDSCPTDEDSFIDATQKMNWEGSYATTPDSLKLGYWTNFDEDIGYDVIMLKGDVLTTIIPPDPASLPSDGSAPAPGAYPADTISICWATFMGPDGNGLSSPEGAVDSSGHSTFCLKINSKAREERQNALNPFYYSPKGDHSGNDFGLGYDMFVRVYTQDKGQYEPSGGWEFPASGRNEGGSPRCPAPPWSGAWLVAKSELDQPNDYYTQLKDEDGVLYTGSDSQELNVGGDRLTMDTTYPMDYGTGVPLPYVLGEMWKDSSLRAFRYRLTKLNGAVQDVDFLAASTNSSVGTNVTGSVKFACRNAYKFDTNSPADWINTIKERGGPYYGCRSELVSVFDNIRVIYPRGFLASTPFSAKSADDNSNIVWGTVTWNSAEPSGTSVSIGLRAADSLSEHDVNWQAKNKGDPLSGFSGRNIQYKATLETRNLGSATLDETGYSTASQTPVFKDITVTYLPPVEFLYVHY